MDIISKYYNSAPWCLIMVTIITNIDLAGKKVPYNMEYKNAF